MRVLHVIHTLDPVKGGPPAVALRLSAAQGSLGHSVRIFSGDASGQEQAVAESMVSIPGIAQVESVTAPVGDGLRDWLLPSAWRARLKVLLGEADFVHVHAVWPVISLVASQVCRGAGVPYCLTLHSQLNAWGLEQKALKKRVALALGFRGMLQHAAFLHTLNADETAQATQMNLRPPMHEMPNGVFMQEVEPLPERGTFRRTIPGLGDRPVVLFLSRLHKQKGIDILAAAFERVAAAYRDAVLVIAGPDGGERSATEATLNAAGISDRVRFVGPIYGRMKYAAMADADVFCLPSRMEGFSMAITEAMACGTPVVISRGCNFPEVQAAGAGVVVNSLDPADVAGAIGRLLADAGLRERSGRAGRDLVRSRYTWPVIAARSIELYEHHLARALPPYSNTRS